MLWIEQEIHKTKNASDARLCCYFICRLDNNWDIAVSMAEMFSKYAAAIVVQLTIIFIIN